MYFTRSNIYLINIQFCLQLEYMYLKNKRTTLTIKIILFHHKIVTEYILYYIVHIIIV